MAPVMSTVGRSCPHPMPETETFLPEISRFGYGLQAELRPMCVENSFSQKAVQTVSVDMQNGHSQ